MISFDLGEDLKLLQSTAAKFGQTLRAQARACEKSGGVPSRLAAEYAELGLGLLDLPESMGGAPQGLVASAVVCEALAFGDAGLAVALPQPGAFARLVRAFGSEAQQQEWLSAFVDAPASTVGAVAMSEQKPPEGRLNTRAVKQSNGYVLSGRKDFVLHAGVADRLAVLAELEPNGVTGSGVFVLPAATAGVRIMPREKLVGLEVVHGATIEFNDVRLPASARLGDGDPTARLDRFFAEEGLLYAARAVGVSEASYAYARAYASERKAFGKPIGHFQAIAFLLSDMLIQTEAARWLVRQAAWSADRGDADALAAMYGARAQADEAAFFVTDNGVQILGGHGYIQDHPVEKWMRDARCLALCAGTRQAADLRAAAALLGEAPSPELLPLGVVQPVWT